MILSKKGWAKDQRDKKILFQNLSDYVEFKYHLCINRKQYGFYFVKLFKKFYKKCTTEDGQSEVAELSGELIIYIMIIDKNYCI